MDTLIKSCKKFQSVCKTNGLEYLECVNWYILLFIYLFGCLGFLFLRNAQFDYLSLRWPLHLILLNNLVIWLLSMCM